MKRNTRISTRNTSLIISNQQRTHPKSRTGLGRMPTPQLMPLVGSSTRGRGLSFHKQEPQKGDSDSMPKAGLACLSNQLLCTQVALLSENRLSLWLSWDWAGGSDAGTCPALRKGLSKQQPW